MDTAVLWIVIGVLVLALAVALLMRRRMAAARGRRWRNSGWTTAAPGADPGGRYGAGESYVVEIAGEKHVLRSDVTPEYTRSVAAQPIASSSAKAVSGMPTRAGIVLTPAMSRPMTRLSAKMDSP